MKSQAALFRAFATLMLLICLCPCSAAPSTKGVGIVIYADPGKPGKNDSFIFEYLQISNLGGGIEVRGPDGKPYGITNSNIKAIVPYPDYTTLGKSSPQTATAKLTETIKTYPTSKRYLQPWIDRLQPPPAMLPETSTGAASISLSDGTKLQGCSLKLISDGNATVVHQAGVSRIPLADLDSAARRTLTATTVDWSFDNPGVSPKDASGKYPRIVCKNGRLLSNAKFKEVSEGNLIFMIDRESVSVPVDQFPAALSVLGEEAVWSYGQAK
ncbi:MAG: hypothetical protein WCP35_19050 [Verrucomicrobiota bacterium]